jgi:hypothetical protein
VDLYALGDEELSACDVILTAYACSHQANCSMWASQFFQDEPLVLAVPGNEGSFVRKARQWAATGDAFMAAVQELSPGRKDIQIRRRALITFAGGWQLAHNILLQPEELERLDACILEDGLHARDLDPWVRLATRAVSQKSWFAMAHTQNGVPSISSKDAHERIFRLATASDPDASQHSIPPYITDPPIPGDGIKVNVMPVRDATGTLILPAQTKIWTKDSLEASHNAGNLYMFEYRGHDRPDHAYVAYHVAPRLWRLLAEHWTDAARTVHPQT